VILPKHMTEDELRKWGHHELARRAEDIGANVRLAKSRAVGRRKEARLSPSQAAWAVGEAQRERRHQMEINEAVRHGPGSS
jgi:hypothetical protein